MSRKRKQKKLVRRITKKIRKSLTKYVGQPLVVEDIEATMKVTLYDIETQFPFLKEDK